MNLLDKIKSDKPQTTTGVQYYKPEVDIYEDENSLKLYFDIPGSDKDKLNIKVEKDILTLIAETENFIPPKAKSVTAEFRYGHYNRSFTLPDYIDENKISAKYKNGVLELSLPKVEAVKPRQVLVQTN